MNPQITQNGNRNNNLNAIRLLAALWIMLGHMGPILGVEAIAIGSVNIHSLGVATLFLISGYLNTLSWKRDPHYGRFVLRRFLRLWPAYAVMVLIMAFMVGPWLSNLGWDGYYQSWWKAYLDNLRFYIVYAQPGVFTENPIPYVTNGSFWTMPVEMVCYLLIPLELWITSTIEKKGKSSFPLVGLLTIVMCAINLWLSVHPEVSLVVYATNWVSAFRMMCYFQIGVLYTYPQMKKWLSPQGILITVPLLMICKNHGPVLHYVAMQIVWTYIVMSLALAEKPLFSQVGSRFELSYGIYIYGFFFQQLVVQWKLQNGYGWGVISCFLISLAMTLAAAFLNSILIEKPVQKGCNWLTREWRQASEERMERQKRL